MFAPERHQTILDLARERGRVDVRDLADQLDVTPETIRRDLTSLERRGLVRRAHGGAVPIERAALNRGIHDRETHNAAEKTAIGSPSGSNRMSTGRVTPSRDTMSSSPLVSTAGFASSTRCPRSS